LGKLGKVPCIFCTVKNLDVHRIESLLTGKPPALRYWISLLCRRTFAVKRGKHEAMRPYQRNKIFCVGTHHRCVRAVWPCNCYCAVVRGHLGCRSSATGMVARRSRARKGADGRILAREAGSARPTPARSGLRALPTLYAFGQVWRAAILAAVPSMWMEHGRGFFRPGVSRAVAAPVMARTAGFQPEKPGLHDQPRRAVDCAPYQLSAFLL